MTKAVSYKFVELSIVTDETIEAAVNEWVGRGWQLDAIRFVTSEASRRPTMAFVSFVRPVGDDDDEDLDEDAGAGRKRKRLSRDREVIELGEIELGDDAGDVRLELGEPIKEG